MLSLPHISVTHNQLLNQYAELFNVSVEDALDKALSHWFHHETGKGLMLIEHRLSQHFKSVIQFPARASGGRCLQTSSVIHKHHRRVAAN